MSELTLIATATFGMEAVVSRELKQLGYTDQSIQDGRITFQASEEAICRCNLWLRSADRLLLQIGQFQADDFGVLFDETKAIPWADWLPANACFPVRGKSVRSQLHSVPDCQRLVKKAVAEKLKETYRKDWFPEDGPEFPIEIAMLKDTATLSIDTTGPGLHRRGYRTEQGIAPLRETLAAGLIQLSFWNESRPFWDPCCGSGTLPIEAALIGLNRAPGMNRTFLSERWTFADHWWKAREEARDLQKTELAFPLLATDNDYHVLKSARQHAQQAGVEEYIHFQQQEIAEISTSRKYGCLITNPPYGERMGDEESLAELNAEFARLFQEWETWSFYLITSDTGFEKSVDRKADRRRKLYNGNLECTYYQYYGPRPPRPRPPSSTEQTPDTESETTSQQEENE